MIILINMTWGINYFTSIRLNPTQKNLPQPLIVFHMTMFNIFTDRSKLSVHFSFIITNQDLEETENIQ